MKFAICNEMFEGWDFRSICEAAKAAGYSGVELAPFTLGKAANEVTTAERKTLRDTAESAGVEISSTHWLLAHTSGLHVSSPDEAVRDKTIDYLVHLINLTADVGAQVMVFGSPKQRCVAEGMSPADAWGLAADTFGSIVPALEDRSVTFCLEPLAPAETNVLNTAADVARMVSEVGSEHVQLILDVKAMSSEQEPMPEIIRENRSILKHFHANDANMRGPGFGKTDFGPIAAALKEIRYNRWISVEVFDFSPDPVTIATRSIEYLKSVFA